LPTGPDVKFVTLVDEWEMFRFRFTIFTPNTIENEDELYLTIGDSSEPLSMKKTAKTEKWMIHKYG